MATEKKINGFDKWEVENAVRTMIEAKNIKLRPKFYAAVRKEARRQAEAAQEIAKGNGGK